MVNHGYSGKRIVCKCGLSFPPEKFEQHITEEAIKEFSAELKAMRSRRNLPGKNPRVEASW